MTTKQPTIAADQQPKYSERDAGMILAGAFRRLIDYAGGVISNTEDLLELSSEMRELLVYTRLEEFLQQENNRRAGC